MWNESVSAVRDDDGIGRTFRLRRSLRGTSGNARAIVFDRGETGQRKSCLCAGTEQG